jgi:hypothetical protein
MVSHAWACLRHLESSSRRLSMMMLGCVMWGLSGRCRVRLG